MKTGAETSLQFWLVGLRLDPNSSCPDFFMLLRDHPEYWPITLQGQIIFFQEAEAVQFVLDLYLRALGLPPSRAPTEIYLVLDFAKAFHLLSEQSRDEKSCVLNIINTLLDMLKATSITIPAMYREDLHQLADHLTFSPDFGTFIKNEQLGRAELIEALQWALGAVMTRATFLPKCDGEMGSDSAVSS